MARGRVIWWSFPYGQLIEDGMNPMIGMMRALVVGSATQTQLPVIGDQKRLDQLIRRATAK